MPSLKSTAATQQPMLLIWASEVVRSGDNAVQVVAKKPLFRMSTKQAAKCLGVTPWTIRKLWRAGLMKGYKPGAVAARCDGRTSNAALVLDAESVLRYKAECEKAA